MKRRMANLIEWTCKLSFKRCLNARMTEDVDSSCFICCSGTAKNDLWYGLHLDEWLLQLLTLICGDSFSMCHMSVSAWVGVTWVLSYLVAILWICSVKENG